MRYYPKGTLRDVLCHRDLHELELMVIFEAIIDGLIFMQQKQIVHRDLKPENILVTADYESVLSDLGAAVDVSDSPDKLKTVIGTFYYQPPEVFKHS